MLALTVDSLFTAHWSLERELSLHLQDDGGRKNRHYFINSTAMHVHILIHVILRTSLVYTALGYEANYGHDTCTVTSER